MLFDEEQLGQRLPGGEHRGVELGELRLPIGQSAAHVGQRGVALALIALGLLELGAQHFDALFALGGGDLLLGRRGLQRGELLLRSTCKRAAAVACSVSSSRRPLLRRRVVARASTRLRIRSTAHCSSMRLQLVGRRGRRRATLVRAGRGRRQCAGDARRVWRRDRPTCAVAAASCCSSLARSSSSRAWSGCWWASCFSSSASCSWQARSSLRRESKPAEACRGPTTSVPSAVKQFAVAGDEREPAAGGLRESQRRGEPIDEPGATEQPLDERHEFGGGFDEAIGPAHHARLRWLRSTLGRRFAAARHVVEPQEADAAGDAERLFVEPIEEPAGRGDDDVLRELAERDVDQRRGIDVDVEQIGHHAADFAVGPVRIVLRRRASTSLTPEFRPSSRWCSSVSTSIRSRVRVSWLSSWRCCLSTRTISRSSAASRPSLAWSSVWQASNCD